MIRTLRLLRGYVWINLVLWMGVRSFLFTLVVNQAITPLIGLAVWTTALRGETAVSSYYVALLAVRLLTVSYENHTFSNRIYAGELADDLLKPHDVVVSPLGMNLAIRLLHGLVGLPMLAAAAALAGAGFNMTNLALAIPALLLAAGLRFVFTYLLALSALWTQRAHGVVGFGDVLLFLLGGEAAPVPLLPEPLRSWVAALPFRAMLGLPAEVATGYVSGSEVLAGYALQLAWTAAFVALVAVVWRRGVRRYEAVGG